MDSARKIMEKYGWRDGDGLGQNKDGIVKPLKASMKFDSAGFGLDRANEFNNHWWHRVFNEAATNISVQNNGDTISMDVKDQNLVEISTKEYSTQKLQKLTQNDSYSNFIKHSTLTNQGYEVKNTNKIDTDEIQFTQYKALTDEELFAACGNRTAHKGARHGLYMSAKLDRLAKQDAELLSKLKPDSKEIEDEGKMDVDLSDPNDWITMKSKKKKKSKSDKIKKKSNTNNNEEPTDRIENTLFNADYCIKSKKKRKQKMKTDKELSTSLGGVTIDNKSTDEPSETKPRKRKKSKKHLPDIMLENGVVETDSIINPVNDNTDMDENNEKPHKKKKSKHSRKSIQKSKKEEKKQAKRLQKNIEKITVNLQKSIIENDN